MMIAVAFTGPAQAADGKAIASKQCASCHKLKGPAVTTIAEVLKRKAPDLFYAGSKFNAGWLEAYIQNPTTIRPAGTVYVNNITLEGDTDVIKSVPKCASKLSARDAKAVAGYLMGLKDKSMKSGVVTIGKFSKARAKLLMYKKNACNACHTDPKKGGGISCPTFEGIGARLNPDWMYSFIKDPKHWDPKVWMAKDDLEEHSLQLIVNYLAAQK
jgi:cytochrome c551/c552